MMTLQDILAGESKNVEFKEALPERSIKYMKSVVAFANSSGGRIMFGIEDGTCRVVGMNDEYVFQTMDAITNAIVDSCEPAIYPDISLQTIEGKTIIVVEIPAGRQRPYYIKSLGMESGVYVRVSGTSRPADSYQIKELLFEGSNRCFDQTLCLGLEVTADDIQQLCRSMKETALKNCLTDEEKRAVKDVTVRQLISWGILQERDGKYAATNAFALLTGNDILPTAIQCGVFRGITKAFFLDRREYAGPIQDQAEEALQFVLRNIRLGAEFYGLGRRDVYEIPVECIRELILNAVIHRSYLDHGNIQVAVYDDRLEVTSPGKLPMGQSIERMKSGYSIIRNEAIAHAFSYMKLMEHWGSGIPKITERAAAMGLRGPEYLGGDVDLRVNLYRRRDENIDIPDVGSDVTSCVTNNADNVTSCVTNNTDNVTNCVTNNTDNVTNCVTNNAGNVTNCVTNNAGNVTNCVTNNVDIITSHVINDVAGNTYYVTNGSNNAQDDVIKRSAAEIIMSLIQYNPKITQEKMAEESGVTTRTVKRILLELQEKGVILRKGSNRSGVWLIKNDTVDGIKNYIEDGGNMVSVSAMTPTARKILPKLLNDPKITQKELAEESGVTIRTIKRILFELQEKGIVTREGSPRFGRWIVNKIE